MKIEKDDWGGKQTSYPDGKDDLNSFHDSEARSGRKLRKQKENEASQDIQKVPTDQARQTTKYFA